MLFDNRVCISVAYDRQLIAHAAASNRSSVCCACQVTVLIILKRCPEQRLRTSGYMLSKAWASMRPPRCSKQLAIGEQVRAMSTHLDRAPVHSPGVLRIIKLRQCCERLEVWAGIVVQLLLCTHHWLTACPDCPLRRVKSTSKDHTMHVARRL